MRRYGRRMMSGLGSHSSRRTTMTRRYCSSSSSSNPLMSWAKRWVGSEDKADSREPRPSPPPAVIPKEELNTEYDVPIIEKADILDLMERRSRGELNFALIDVREPHELRHGVIPGSINIPLGELGYQLTLRPVEWRMKHDQEKPTPEEPFIYSCRSGKRVLTAVQLSAAMGYWPVAYLGSFLDWFPDRNY